MSRLSVAAERGVGRSVYFASGSGFTNGYPFISPSDPRIIRPYWREPEMPFGTDNTFSAMTRPLQTDNTFSEMTKPIQADKTNIAWRVDTQKQFNITKNEPNDTFKSQAEVRAGHASRAVRVNPNTPQEKIKYVGDTYVSVGVNASMFAVLHKPVDDNDDPMTFTSSLALDAIKFQMSELGNACSMPTSLFELALLKTNNWIISDKIAWSANYTGADTSGVIRALYGNNAVPGRLWNMIEGGLFTTRGEGKDRKWQYCGSAYIRSEIAGNKESGTAKSSHIAGLKMAESSGAVMAIEAFRNTAPYYTRVETLLPTGEIKYENKLMPDVTLSVAYVGLDPLGFLGIKIKGLKANVTLQTDRVIWHLDNCGALAATGLLGLTWENVPWLNVPATVVVQGDYEPPLSDSHKVGDVNVPQPQESDAVNIANKVLINSSNTGLTKTVIEVPAETYRITGYQGDIVMYVSADVYYEKRKFGLRPDQPIGSPIGKAAADAQIQTYAESEVANDVASCVGYTLTDMSGHGATKEEVYFQAGDRPLGRAHERIKITIPERFKQFPNGTGKMERDIKLTWLVDFNTTNLHSRTVKTVKNNLGSTNPNVWDPYETDPAERGWQPDHGGTEDNWSPSGWALVNERLVCKARSTIVYLPRAGQ